VALRRGACPPKRNPGMFAFSAKAYTHLSAIGSGRVSGPVLQCIRTARRCGLFGKTSPSTRRPPLLTRFFDRLAALSPDTQTTQQRAIRENVWPESSE